MIGKILSRIFRVQPAPTTTTPEPEQRPVEPEQAEPQLPVEPGFHYDRQRDHYGHPGPPKLRAHTLEHLWAGEADRQDMRQALSEIESKMLREDIRDSEIARLIEQDQSAADFDDRQGHVVLPEQEFEYHGNLAEVRYPASAGSAVRRGAVYTLQSEAALTTYDREKLQLTHLPNQVQRVEGGNFDHHTQTLVSGSFSLSARGELAIPTATTLEEADAVAEMRELAQRADAALRWIERVREASEYRLDQGELDHDPRPGHVVAGKVREYWFLKESDLHFMNTDSYSIETSPEGIRVYNDTFPTPRLMLKSETRGRRTEVQQVLGDGESSLHLSWDRDQGKILAEVRQDPNFKPPEAGTGLFYSSGPKYAPEAPPRREALPHGFSRSERIKSHGGGHHVMVRSESGNPHDYGFPRDFTDPDTGKEYYQTSYTRLDGSRLYVEREPIYLGPPGAEGATSSR